MRKRKSPKTSWPVQPTSLPEGVGQRLGADHQRVDRDERALVAGQLGRERLRGSHDDVGAHVAGRGRRDVRLEAGDRGALVDGHPQPLHDVRETAGEAGRVDGGAVRRVAGAEAPGHLDARAHLGGAEQAGSPPRRSPTSVRTRPPRAARSSCTGVSARSSWPPRWKRASMPSSSTTRAISYTVWCRARCWSITACRPCVLGGVSSREPGKVVWHQPPLRPEAPNPAISRSSTAMRRCGSAFLR